MITKHIGHLAIESLKYFFNIDHGACYHAFTTFLVMAGFIKLFLNRIMFVLHTELLTVKEDLLTIRTHFHSYIEREDLIK